MASRQYKLLRSMAREVRGIRESLLELGISEDSMPGTVELSELVETADFAYARLQDSRETYKAGYAPSALDEWADTLKDWAKSREVYAFFISGAKARDPLAALELIKRTGRPDD